MDEVRAKLAAAKLHIERVEDDGEGDDIDAALSARAILSKHKSAYQVRRTRDAVWAAQTRKDAKPYYCVICETNTVDAENGIDTCPECAAKKAGTDL